MAYYAYLGRENLNSVLNDLEATKNGVPLFQHLVSIAQKRSFETFAMYLVDILEYASEHLQEGRENSEETADHLLRISGVFSDVGQYQGKPYALDEFSKLGVSLDWDLIANVQKAIDGRKGETEYLGMMPSLPHYDAFAEMVNACDIDRVYCVVYAVFSRLSMDRGNTLSKACQDYSFAATTQLVLNHKKHVAQAGDEPISASPDEVSHLEGGDENQE